MKNKALIFSALLLVLTAYLLVFAGEETVPVNLHIKELMDNTRKYENRLVIVKGIVEERNGLLFKNLFHLNDGTGSIRVLSNKALPNVGEELTVHGEFQEKLAVGPYIFRVIVEK